MATTIVSPTHELPHMLAFASQSKMIANDSIPDKSSQILAIIRRHSIKKLPDAEDRLNLGTPHFLATIKQFVRVAEPVQMSLPAFPPKSANKTEKALGILPDMAEEVSLSMLNDMCNDIGVVYEPGAHLTIISDGLMYNGQSKHFAWIFILLFIMC
jgi:pyoverdine/dityrosine biosynthesis protein Dit1